jgi:methyl-accepting chemotaxis protein
MPVADQIHRVNLEYSHDGESSKVGILELHATEKYIRQKLHNEVVNTAVQVAITDLILFIAIYFLMHSVVLTPLRKVNDAMDILNSGEADLSTQIPHNGIVEFDKLMDSLNRFIVKLGNVMGGTINHVQETIASVAQGDLPTDSHAEKYLPNSIMARLAAMNSNLCNY